MKKLISVLLATVLALSLAACQRPQAQPVPAETEPSQTQPAQTEPPATEPPATGEAPTMENAFQFTRETFPRLDGSTSMVPLAEAVASVLLGEDRESVTDLCQFNRTTQSFRNLAMGECDLLLAGEPNAAVFTEMEEQGFAYEIETIAMDGLVFLVNENNPVDSLTTDQIRDIYTGKITNWSQVGGSDAEIIPFQRNEGAGSQALMKKLVMGDTPLADPPEEYMASSMGELMSVVKSYDNSANAIGYSVYYYANDMQMAQGLKLLKVDGVEPSRETIRSGEYPHRNAYYCVIPASAGEDSPNRILFDWLMSEDGQKLIDLEGYVAAGK
jgi:ABC-type phosphate transport system substrate-binding protein